MNFDTKEPTHCKKCGLPLIKKEYMFYLKEIGSMPGMVCTKCNALYNSKEFIEAVLNRIKSK